MFSPSASATHCALACPDIILEIIEQVSPPLYSSSDGDASKAQYVSRKILAALTLASKAFNGPATKALWSRLDSFLPLMNLFSAFDGRRTTGFDTYPTYMISGDIPPHEFSRFCELASFLKAVAPSDCICQFDAPGSDVWHYLARIAGGKPLFPSLRELHWVISQPDSAEILFLLPSSLRRLTVCYGGSSEDTHVWRLSQIMLFRTIFNIIPLLTHLTLKDIHHTLLPACLSNVNVLHGLSAVSLCQDESVDLTILRTLSSMESLQEFSFAADIDWFEEPVDFSGFPALKKLDIDVMSGSADSVRSFLNSFSSPGLRQLTLETGTELLGMYEISATCTLFAQRFPSLEDLTWTLLTRLDVPLKTALAPLFPLRMTKLSLDLHTLPTAAPAFPDDLFASLARAWPQLATLWITTPDERSDNVPGPDTITARTLLTLALGCPHLRTLRLPRMEGPRMEDVPRYPVLRPGHGLRRLFVDRTRAVNRPEDMDEEESAACAFALLLDRLFPELDLDWDVEGFKGTQNLRWRRVVGGVRLCRLGRTNLVSE